MKITVILTTIIIILLAILLFVPGKKSSKITTSNISPTQTQEDKEIAIEKAKQLFAEKKTAGLSMENGPCLSEEIISDWVVDVAHNPRLPVDNLPENQCLSYRSDKTHHFVELDPAGNLIRAL